MKVLFLNYEYPPLGGGAANATACILEEWAVHSTGSEMEVHLITSGISAELDEAPLSGKVFIHRLPIGKNENNLHHQSIGDVLLYSWRAWWFSRKLIKKQSEPFDATLAFFGVPCGFLALLLKWEFRIPYIVSLRGSDVPGYSRKYAWLYPFIRPIIRLVWRFAAAVVPNSAGLEELAKQSAPNQPFTIIENGVDIRRFVPDQTKRPNGEFIITPGASRVTERKGLNYLVEAVGMLATQYPDVRLKVMGDGSARPELEALVREKGLQEKVTFLGRVPREETAPYYQEASLFVLPSLNEGMSNAMLEALASGLPIIATPTGGTTELVQEKVNGIVVPERSAEALAKAIEVFLQNRELVVKYGSESRKRAETQGWNMVAKNFQSLLERCSKK